MKELLLFGSAFIAVFALGFNSLNVNAGRYLAAFTTSCIIGIANLSLFKFAPHVETVTEGAAYVIAGPLAIVSAMWVFRNVFSKEKRVEED